MATIDQTRAQGATASSNAAVSEAVAGIIAIILTILGLAKVSPDLLVAIATIVVGIALVLRGTNLVAGYAGAVARSSQQQAAIADLGGAAAWSVELFAGGAGIVLGILALLQVAPTDLVAIAAIGFGSALVISGQSSTQLNLIKVMNLEIDEPLRRMTGAIQSSSVGIQAITALAAIVLGILALAGFVPVVLVLIALLSLGSFILLNGPTSSGTLLLLLRR